MLQTEFVRNLNCNYERILLDKKPEESRYQYCILGRGGIKGLLPCSLRYLNGLAYLYYDISSTQNVAQLYSGRNITRKWMKDFFWSMRQIRQELGRFLLDEHNIIWNPEQIFQDLEKNNFCFLYVPYYEGECGFLKLLDYWVEHINYEDEILVECVYKMHEQYELLGQIYLQEQIFEDAEVLDQVKEAEEYSLAKMQEMPLTDYEKGTEEQSAAEADSHMLQEKDTEEGKTSVRKGIWYLLENRMKRQKENRAEYSHEIRSRMSGYAVCEEPVYQTEDLGKTIYIEETNQEEAVHGLYSQQGERVALLEKASFVIGKKKEEVDYASGDNSVSRVHARIVQEKGLVYLEDLNSTNGTFKNGLRLQPYEKRILESEDEIRLGKVILVYR